MVESGALEKRYAGNGIEGSNPSLSAWFNKILIFMDTSKLIINTERMSLVPISLKYGADICKEFTKEITTHMVPQPSGKIEDVIAFIEKSLNKMRAGKTIQQAIINIESGEFLGCVGLHDIDIKNPKLGIWIKASAHGNKYGREAVRVLKDWADQNLEYEYLEYPVTVENIPSRKIVESLGGKIEREYIDKNQNGEAMNELEYRIYKRI